MGWGQGGAQIVLEAFIISLSCAYLGKVSHRFGL